MVDGAYLDTSVALAHLLAEDRCRPDAQTIEVASYDERFLSAAIAMGFTVSRHCQRR